MDPISIPGQVNYDYQLLTTGKIDPEDIGRCRGPLFVGSSRHDTVTVSQSDCQVAQHCRTQRFASAIAALAGP